MKWIETIIPKKKEEIFRKKLGISKCLSYILLSLGITNIKDANLFLNPSLKDLKNPFLIKNLDLATNKIIEVIKNNEKIIIVGDYDVDGVTSTSLLFKVLEYFTKNINFLIPKRSEDGYGLTKNILNRCIDENPKLLIALDCGTNSLLEIEVLLKNKIDVIIVDHHKNSNSINKKKYNFILVNPHINKSNSQKEYQIFCTVGIVFKLVQGIIKKLRELNNLIANKINLRDFLYFVATGTIADMVPLTKENRIITKFGLKNIFKNNGLKALCEISGINIKNAIKPSDISFKIAPRINASGRLENASLSVKMLINDDFNTSLLLANQLEIINKKRQLIEKKMIEEAISLIEENKLLYNNLFSIIMFKEDWHPGIVGIVASKLSKLYYKPCFIFGKENNFLKGSGRSIDGINIITALNKISEHLVNWGGHPMAAGITIKKENFFKFQESLNNEIKLQASKINKEILEPTLNIVYWISLEELNLYLLEELSLLEPFGVGNPLPILGIKDIVINKKPILFGNKKEHLQFFIKTPNPNINFIKCIGWNMKDKIPPINTKIDIAFNFFWNNWNGYKNANIQLIDWR